MPAERESPPLACALTATEHAARIAWIEELNARALAGYQRDGHRLRLSYHPAAAAAAREFVRRERQCCPFLRFTTEEGAGGSVVIIDAPTEFGAAADALFASYTGGRTQ